MLSIQDTKPIHGRTKYKEKQAKNSKKSLKPFRDFCVKQFDKYKDCILDSKNYKKPNKETKIRLYLYWEFDLSEATHEGRERLEKLKIKNIKKTDVVEIINQIMKKEKVKLKKATTEEEKQKWQISLKCWEAKLEDMEFWKQQDKEYKSFNKGY